MHALFGATPVVPLEEDVEPEFFPNLELVLYCLCVRHVHVTQALHDRQPLGKRDEGLNPLVEREHLVGDDPGYQEVTLELGMPEQVQMPNVEQVECPWRVADPDLGHQYAPVGLRRTLTVRQMIIRSPVSDQFST